MTREERIKAIYEAMANKKRTFGCRWKTLNWESVTFIRKNRGWKYLYMRRNKEFMIPLWYTPKVIWNPVMIWDVLDYMSKIKFDIKKTSSKLWLSFDDRDTDESKLFLIKEHYYSTLPIRWLNLREPIEAQSDECIDYVYGLIPSKSME